MLYHKFIDLLTLATREEPFSGLPRIQGIQGTVDAVRHYEAFNDKFDDADASQLG